MFLRNFWYVAAMPSELDGGAMLGRWILGEPLLIYRTAAGTVAAMSDICPHRSARLSAGERDGDTVRCLYDGLESGPDGRCTRIPAQDGVPKDALRVRTYAVSEKWRLIWVWMGDPAAADETLIPALTWLDDPDWTCAAGYIHMKADYRLLVDNLLDLTHVSYIHKQTIAGDPKEALVPVSTTRDGDSIRVERWMLGFTAPPMYDKARRFDGPVDRWQLIRWQAPATVTLDIGCADAGTGAPEGDRSQGISMWSNHIITPETDTTTHYHWCFARNYKLDDAEVTDLLVKGGLQTFMEDVVILEEQQRALGSVGDRPVIDINIDNAPLQFRRILGEKIAAESGRIAAE